MVDFEDFIGTVSEREGVSAEQALEMPRPCSRLREVGKARGERNREQESEENLHAGLRHAELL